MVIDPVKVRDNPHLLGRFLGYDKLSGIHSQWIKQTWGSKIDCALQAHRNSYKTTAIVVVGIIWYLLFRPESRILILRKEFDGAASVLREIRGHYEGEKMRWLYHKVYGIQNVRTENWRASSFTLATKSKPSKEGNVECAGIGANLTGSHYDRIVADDIVTDKDRYSPAERENTKRFVQELQNIKTVDGAIIFPGTPWHEDDAWKIMPEPDKYDIYRLAGQIDGFTPEKLESIRKTMWPSLFAANYELKHTSDEDRLFTEPNYDRHFPNPKNQYIVAYLDPAFGGADYSALVIGLEFDGFFWILGGFIWQGTIDATYNLTEKFCQRFEVAKLIVEANQAQRLIAFELRKRKLNVAEKVNVRNKHLRIQDAVKKNWDKIVFAQNIDKAFMRQLLDYSENAKNDDAPDALAGLIESLAKKSEFKYGVL